MGNTYSFCAVEKTTRSGRWVPVFDYSGEFGKRYRFWDYIHNNTERVTIDHDNQLVIFPRDFFEDTLRRLRVIRPIIIQHVKWYNEWGEPFFINKMVDENTEVDENEKRILDYWMPVLPDQVWVDEKGEYKDVYYDSEFFSDMYKTLQVFENVNLKCLEDGVCHLALTW